MIAFLGAFSINCSVVTFYTTLNSDELTYSLNMTEIKTLICDKQSASKIIALKQDFKIPCLKNLILFDELS